MSFMSLDEYEEFEKERALHFVGHEAVMRLDTQVSRQIYRQFDGLNAWPAMLWKNEAGIAKTYMFNPVKVYRRDRVLQIGNLLRKRCEEVFKEESLLLFCGAIWYDVEKYWKVIYNRLEK